MNNGQKLELKRARLDNRLTSGWQGGKGPFVTFWEWIASGKIVLDADVDYLNYQPFPSKIDQHIAVVCGYKDVIERCLVLWSNPGESIFTPFMGVGSEVCGALMNGRKGLGVELKPSYYRQAQKNIAFTLEHGWTEASDQEEMFSEDEIGE